MKQTVLTWHTEKTPSPNTGSFLILTREGNIAEAEYKKDSGWFQYRWSVPNSHLNVVAWCPLSDINIPDNIEVDPPKNDPPTQNQLDYIKSITNELGIEFNGKTKEDARQWLSKNVPKYKEYLNELNLMHEANMQEIYDNYGDQI